MKILVVEDDHESRVCVTGFLGELGHEVTGCANGHEALEWLLEQEFSFVFSDLRMPGLSGVELLRKIRANPQYDGVSVVLFSGHGNKETRDAALREGALNFLTKPLQLNDLIGIVRRVETLQSR